MTIVWMQVAIQSVEARIPQVAITSADGAPGIFFTGNGSASLPPPPSAGGMGGMGGMPDYGQPAGSLSEYSNPLPVY